MINILGNSRTYESITARLKKEEQKLDDILLFIDFLDNGYDLPIILLKDGSLLLLFEISGVDYEQLSPEERVALSEKVKFAFLQLDEEFTVSNYLDRDINELFPLEKSGEAPDVIKYVQEKKQKFWNTISVKSHSNRIFCSVRYYDSHKKEVPLKGLFFEKQLFNFSEKELNEKITKFFHGYMIVKSALKGFGFFPLDKQESFSVLYKMINFAAPPAYRKNLQLNIQLAHSAYTFNGDSFITGTGISGKIISIKYLPEESFPIYFERLYDLNIRFVIKQSFRTVDFSRMERNLKGNQNIARSLSSIDKSSQHYVGEVDDFISEIQVNREKPVKWNLSILLISKDRAYLDEKVYEVLSLLREIGSSGMTEMFNLKSALFGMLPGHERLNGRCSTILTSNVGDLFSAYLLYRGDRDPVDYFKDRTSGIFSYTPFTSRENAWHMAITGPTGGGKSFMVNKILLSSLIKEPRIYVIDLSGSFSEFFDFLSEELPEETSVLKVTKNEINFSFNPFLIKDLDGEIPEQQMKFCEGLLKIMIGSNLINEGNRIILTDTLKQFFLQYKSILRNLRGRVPSPPLDILIPVLEQNSSVREIQDALRYWKEGRRGQLFNSGKDSVSSAKYIYYDIRDMEGSGEEMAAIIYTIFNKIYSDISNPEFETNPKILIMDEAHRYLKQKEFSFWIDLLIRTGRHFKLMVGIVTQSINDLICEEEWSTGIVNNLKQAFFFSGQKNIEDSFLKLQMSENHIDLYNGMSDSLREFLYWSSKGIRRILTPLTDPYTYWLATTNPDERILRKKIKSELFNGDTKRTIEAFVRETEGCEDSADSRISSIVKFYEREKEIK